jgi:CubicO group peptidase (beta-lactamase class C family)
MSDVDTLREPQRHQPYAEVPASVPRAWATRPVPLRATVAGAGRIMDLDEFLAVTVATALVVVVDGVLVHERYFHGTGAGDRLLGFSATKSALALVVGQAADEGRFPGLDTRVTDLVPELGSSGYAGVSLRQLLTMTSGVGWREDYHDPDSRFRRATRRAAGTPTARRTPWPWTGRGSERPASPSRRRWHGCGRRSRRSGRPWSGWTSRAASPWPAARWPPPRATGRASARCRSTADGGTGRWSASPGLRRAAGPSGKFLVPGRLPSTITTHAGFGYHWWPLDPAGEHLTADGMRGQFVYVDRPRRIVVVKTSAWPYEDPWWDRQCRDLCYLALPAIAAAAAG